LDFEIFHHLVFCFFGILAFSTIWILDLEFCHFGILVFWYIIPSEKLPQILDPLF